MKKLILAGLLCASQLAHPATYATPCAPIAEGAVIVAQLANKGVTWERISEIHDRKETADTGIIREIHEEAYYSWSKLGDETVRSLAYMKCKPHYTR